MPAPATSRLLRWLAARQAPDEVRLLSNKDRFYTWAAGNGLPLPALIGAFQAGKFISASHHPSESGGGTGAAVLPHMDLFSKPSDGAWASGARLWKWLDAEQRFEEGGRRYPTGPGRSHWPNVPIHSWITYRSWAGTRRSPLLDRA